MNLTKKKIINYQINEDGTVDADSVDLKGQGLETLPCKFGKIAVFFDISLNRLTSLAGCPTEVGNTFDCGYNLLKNLEGCPEIVGRHFICRNNELTSIKGVPWQIKGDFDCGQNKLTNLEGAPFSIRNNFICDSNNLSSLEAGPKVVYNDYVCSYNKLTNLNGAPQEVGGSMYCNHNKLISFKGAPKKIHSKFSIGYNPDLVSPEGLIIEPGPHHEDYPGRTKFGDLFGMTRLNIFLNIFERPENFLESFKYNYFMGENKIHESRFVRACDELGVIAPDEIEGYIWV